MAGNRGLAVARLVAMILGSAKNINTMTRI
jgi:hypothetical protein